MTEAQISAIRQATWEAYVENHCKGNGGRHTTYDIAKDGRIYIHGLYGRIYVQDLKRGA